jgi:hypothetical protein
MSVAGMTMTNVTQAVITHQTVHNAISSSMRQHGPGEADSVVFFGLLFLLLLVIIWAFLWT